MKTAISIPDDLFQAAEKLAEIRGWSRSHLYSVALADFLEEHGEARITARLDSLYDSEDSSVDPLVLSIQEASIPEDEW